MSERSNNRKVEWLKGQMTNEPNALSRRPYGFGLLEFYPLYQSPEIGGKNPIFLGCEKNRPIWIFNLFIFFYENLLIEIERYLRAPTWIARNQFLRPYLTSSNLPLSPVNLISQHIWVKFNVSELQTFAQRESPFRHISEVPTSPWDVINPGKLIIS